MKEIRYILFAILGTMTFMSCDSFLDTEIDERTTLDTDNKITKILVSAYPNCAFCAVAEWSSDNIDYTGGNWDDATTVFQEDAYAWRQETSTNNESLYRLWFKCWMAISNANEALLAIEKEGNPERLNAQRGEALIARAYSHFVLANMFCMPYKKGSTELGLPYMTKPETTVKPKYERGTIEELYDHINSDIEEGLPLIDDNLFAIPKYHFNEKAAHAFAAQFNLFYQNWDKAITYSSKVLDGNSTLREWETLSNYNTYSPRQNLFVDSDAKANLLLLVAFSSANVYFQNYSGSFTKYTTTIHLMDTEITNAPNPFNAKPYLSADTWTTKNSPKSAVVKYTRFEETIDPIQNTVYFKVVFPLFSTDETLLVRAEAYAMKKAYDNALSDLNRFYQNFGGATTTAMRINSFYDNMEYYKYDEPTIKKRLNPSFAIENGQQENFIHTVLHCRRLLLVHEGFRWFDIKRYGIEIYRRNYDAYAKEMKGYSDFLSKDDPRRALQIPEIAIQGGFEANPR